MYPADSDGCVYSYLWLFRFVAVSVCGLFGLWPFRFAAVYICGRLRLSPFRFCPFRFVAVMTRNLQKGRYFSNHSFQFGIRPPKYSFAITLIDNVRRIKHLAFSLSRLPITFNIHTVQLPQISKYGWKWHSQWILIHQNIYFTCSR